MSQRGTEAQFPCQDHWEPPSCPKGSGLVPGWGWGCHGISGPPTPARDPLVAALPYIPCAPSSWGSECPPQKLRLCSGVALCSSPNPVEIALRKLLSRTLWLPASPRPGTIPVPRVSPAGQAVCSSSLLVARAIIKGLVGPSLLQGFDTLFPTFGAEAGCLCVRHNPVATSPPAPWAAETRLTVP